MGDSAASPIVGLLLLASLAVIYVVPALVAYNRHHHQRAAIAVLNILAGWTAVGWVIALVWAATAVRTEAPAAAQR